MAADRASGIYIYHKIPFSRKRNGNSEKTTLDQFLSSFFHFFRSLNHFEFQSPFVMEFLVIDKLDFYHRYKNFFVYIYRTFKILDVTKFIKKSNMEAWKKRLTQPNLFFSPLRSFRISSVCLTDPETTPFHPSLPPSLSPPPLRIPTAAQLFLLKSQSSITIRIVEKHRANFRRIDSLQRRGGKHEEGRLSQ